MAPRIRRAASSSISPTRTSTAVRPSTREVAVTWTFSSRAVRPTTAPSIALALRLVTTISISSSAAAAAATTSLGSDPTSSRAAE